MYGNAVLNSHIFIREDKMDIGKAIRVYIAKLNISQTKLAKSVGVTRPYMSSLCNNERVPSFGLLESISKSLECRVWELIKEAEE
jgi:transcriptional regulator with XRE-family HTH domain